jgi:hypothetical protein
VCIVQQASFKEKQESLFVLIAWQAQLAPTPQMAVGRGISCSAGIAMLVRTRTPEGLVLLVMLENINPIPGLPDV